MADTIHARTNASESKNASESISIQRRLDKIQQDNLADTLSETQLVYNLLTEVSTYEDSEKTKALGILYNSLESKKDITKKWDYVYIPATSDKDWFLLSKTKLHLITLSDDVDAIVQREWNKDFPKNWQKKIFDTKIIQENWSKFKDLCFGQRISTIDDIDGLSNKSLHKVVIRWENHIATLGTIVEKIATLTQSDNNYIFLVWKLGAISGKYNSCKVITNSSIDDAAKNWLFSAIQVWDNTEKKIHTTVDKKIFTDRLKDRINSKQSVNNIKIDKSLVPSIHKEAKSKWVYVSFSKDETTFSLNYQKEYKDVEKTDWATMSVY